ncbi:Transposable element P transposase [Paramuricea clavata]|uniref:Transposable element P transposase n=1 Tax=Paramuricea clavata TaxID=317549 RepID=A0A7D9DD80_PARCT|nr:Transposable element P transposase [Paramuricea clavata]
MDDAKPEKELCNPCSLTTKNLKKAALRKRKVSTAPAKPKAPFSACRSEKLIATVKASRLAYKQLEDQLEQLKAHIKKHGVGVTKAGINIDNIESLREKASSLSQVQRYVVIVIDERKIQSNLVFDKYLGDLIGFVDLGDPVTNYASLGEEDVMATHALAFLVRGMCSDFRHVIAYYFTENVTSYQLMSIFWKVVGALELLLKLPVCATVNDGASPNCKFFDLPVDLRPTNFQLVRDLNCDVVHKVPNLIAVQRFIFFFADSCHLIKTARNCLYNSGSGSCSRLMWNNGNYLMFKHIADLFYSYQEFALHTLPKLSLDHIVLTSYSKMKVKLATQVLSKSVAIALEESENDEVLGTAKFCWMINDFFDCTNVRSLTKHEKKETHSSNHTTYQDDERFSWLKDVFLNYLETWKQSTIT